MGKSDDGNASAAFAQTRRPDSRIHGSDQDLVALVVSGGSGGEAQFDVAGLRAPDLADPVRSIGEPSGSSAKQLRSPRGMRGGGASGRAHPTYRDGVRPAWPAVFGSIISLEDGCLGGYLDHKDVFFGRFFRLMNNSG